MHAICNISGGIGLKIQNFPEFTDNLQRLFQNPVGFGKLLAVFQPLGYENFLIDKFW
jgi:hypothetical protein